MKSCKSRWSLRFSYALVCFLMQMCYQFFITPSTSEFTGIVGSPVWSTEEMAEEKSQQLLCPLIQGIMLGC